MNARTVVLALRFTRYVVKFQNILDFMCSLGPFKENGFHLKCCANTGK